MSDFTGLILMKIVQKYDWSWKDLIFPMQNIFFLLILKCDPDMFLIIFARLTPLQLLLELLLVLGFQQWLFSYFGIISLLYFWLCIWASESIFFDHCDLKSKHADAAPQSLCCRDMAETLYWSSSFPLISLALFWPLY